MPSVAVVDVETTGLNPYRHDRIVELAALIVGSDGTALREFETLVNPERDIGPTHVHGLTSGDVLNAPPIWGDSRGVDRGSFGLRRHSRPKCEVRLFVS